MRQRNHSHRSGTHRKNIAPGLNRSFACEDWQFIDRNIWKEERQAAFEAINTEPAPVGIFARDISSRAIAAAEENAGEAGVADFIDFRRADIKALRQLAVRRMESYAQTCHTECVSAAMMKSAVSTSRCAGL